MESVGSYLAYRELDTYGSTDIVADSLRPYTAPYLIWGNAAYRQDHDLLAQAQALSLPETISSHYLGALTCQLAGFQGYDGYVDFLNDLRTRLPVSSVYGYQLPDGSYTATLPSDLQALEDIRRKWQVLSHEEAGRPIKYRSLLPVLLLSAIHQLSLYHSDNLKHREEHLHGIYLIHFSSLLRHISCSFLSNTWKNTAVHPSGWKLYLLFVECTTQWCPAAD